MLILVPIRDLLQEMQYLVSKLNSNIAYNNNYVNIAQLLFPSSLCSSTFHIKPTHTYDYQVSSRFKPEVL